MRKMGKHYVALHLRFEHDMLAFSGCYYGGGKKERKGLERREGRYLLTPEEVGLMLRALGYSKDVYLYVTSGEVYGGDETIVPLRALFPNIHSKDTIATKDELEPFSTSHLVWLNMAKIWPVGGGNFESLTPLSYAWVDSGLSLLGYIELELIREVSWGTKRVRPGRGKFHENPATCICEDTEAKSRSETLPRKFGKANIDLDEVVTDQDIENEPEASDQDEDDDLMGPQFLQSVNETNVDDDPSISELPELEELLSD
ncbi:GDP-fucose protein O-fucosyltransferase [Tanacetum coccineum]